MLVLACGNGGEGGNNASGNTSSDAYGERTAQLVTVESVTVEMKNLRFEPQGIRVRPGTVVTWVNRDQVLHNVSQIESVFLSQDEMKQGDAFSFKFERPGRFRYQCTFHHPLMNGVVIVEQ